VLLLRRGVTARRLYAVGTAALAMIPVFYLFRAAPDLGGYSFGFPLHNLLGHWAAVLGVCCIATGCGLDTWRRLRRRPDSELPPSEPGPLSAEPEDPEAERGREPALA
jgi:hypothetical protein